MNGSSEAARDLAQWLDWELLRELHSLLETELDSLVTQFYALFAEQTAGMQAALLNADLAQVRELAHAVKGSASNLGLTALAGVASDLELAARHGEADLVRAELTRLRQCARDSATCLVRLGYVRGGE
jgi:HPt (histidine-containing phosphotransfer) domain-containing protein